MGLLQGPWREQGKVEKEEKGGEGVYLVGVRVIVSPSHCAPVPLCPRPIVPLDCSKLLRFRAKVSDFGIFGSILKTAASFVVVVALFYCHLKQCSIANFFV